MKIKILLIFVLILSFSLRFYQLAKFPDGVHIDEASIAFNARLIAETGRDQYGKFFPIFFKSENDYKLPLHVYLTAGFIRVFGYSDIAARIVCALMGIVSIFGISCLTSLIFRSKKIVLLSAFLMAISPWEFYFSRGSTSLEVISSLFFSIITLYFFLKYLRDQNIKYIFLFTVFAIFSLFIHRALTVFTIIFYPCAVVYAITKISIRKDSKKNLTGACLIILFLFAIIFVPLVTRYKSVNFISSSDFKNYKITNLHEDGSTIRNKNEIFPVRLAHNKIIDWGSYFLKNYFAEFDPSLLFFKGFFTPGRAFFYAFEIIFLSVFLINLKTNTRGKTVLPLFLLWVGVSFLSSATALDNINDGRMLISLVGFNIIFTLGFIDLIYWSKTRFGKIIKGVVIILYAFFIFYFFHQFFFHYNLRKPEDRNYNLDKAVQYIEKNKKNYEKIVFGKDIATLYAYFAHSDPSRIQEKTKNLTMNEIDDKFLTDDKNCNLKAIEKNVLYVCFGNQIFKNNKIIQIFRFLDNQPNVILVTQGDENKTQTNACNNLPENVRCY